MEVISQIYIVFSKYFLQKSTLMNLIAVHPSNPNPYPHLKPLIDIHAQVFFSSCHISTLHMMFNAGNASSSEHLKGPKIQSFQWLRARIPQGAYIAPSPPAAPLTRFARLLIAALLFHNVKLFSVSAPVYMYSETFN